MSETSRIISRILILLSASLLLAGCSDGSDNGGGGNPPSVNPAGNNAPVFSGTIVDRNFTAGQAIVPFSGQFTDSDTLDVLTYSVVGILPAGLLINQSSGEISGTPPTASVTNGLRIRVIDGRGGSAESNPFVISIVANNTNAGKLLLSVKAPDQFPNDQTLTTELTEFIERVLAQAIEPLNRVISLPQDLPITVDNCGISNAFYSPLERSVTLCWELFIDTQLEFFSQIGAVEGDTTLAIQFAAAAYIFVLYHEVAHALDDQLDLPIVGNPESAADGIAAVLSIEQFQDFGSAYPLMAGILFTFNDGTSFGGVHPGNADRAGDLICLALGGDSRLANNPAYAGFVQLYADAGRDCVTEYAGRKSAVLTFLPELGNIETVLVASRQDPSVISIYNNEATTDTLGRLAAKENVLSVLRGN